MDFEGITSKPSIVLFLAVSALTAIAGAALAYFGPFREAGFILLFLPLIWGYMILPPVGMLLVGLFCAVLRYGFEALVMLSQRGAGLMWGKLAAEPLFPVLLYVALGAAFYAYRRRQDMMYQQVIRTQSRIAALQLADSLAHDFNNILMVIISQAEMMAIDPKLSPEQRHQAQQILDAGLQGSKMVEQMRETTRKPSMQTQKCCLSEEVRNFLTTLGGILRSGIEISLDLCEDDELPVQLDRQQFQRVLMNLCINARNAMPRGGTLEIRTRRETLRDCEYAVLSVSDTGCGIPPDQVRRIFEPFFTTREDRGGTGLGLTIVRSIVRAHGGNILCHSRQDQGTTFHIRLPLSAPRKPAEAVAGS